MNLYYPKSLYYSDANKRYALFPLLKVFIKNNKEMNNPGLKVFGFSNQTINIVNQVKEADVLILPMSWDFYVEENKEKEARDYIESVKHLKKLVFVFISGDFGVDIPDFPIVRVFRSSGYQSELPKSHVGLPVFHRDPMERYYNNEHVVLRSYELLPVVGFCGQASRDFGVRLKEHLRVVYKNMRYRLGLMTSSPQKIQSTSFNRFKILNLLQTSSKVASNFIIRDQYGGGIQHGRGATKVAVDYFENMKNSDYIICYRGAGNFSVRFYETLAMGRIPVYINTDGFLPLSNSLNWKHHVVWVEPSEINQIEDKILAFHNALSAEEFKILQLENRSLWKDQLNVWSFFFNQIKSL